MVNMDGICIPPHHEHTSKTLRYGTHSQRISQFYLHTSLSSANGMNHTCLFLPSQSWSSFIDTGRMVGWVGLGGWLHTEINVWHRELNPYMVTHLSTNRARRRSTSLIMTNALRYGYGRLRPPSAFTMLSFVGVLICLDSSWINFVVVAVASTKIC